MVLQWLFESINKQSKTSAIIWRNQNFTYQDLANLITNWEKELQIMKVQPGQVIIIEGDYSPQFIALFLALIKLQTIIVPSTNSTAINRDEFIEITEARLSIIFDENDQWLVKHHNNTVKNPLLHSLIDNKKPGMVLFSSGSTGKPKAILHDLEKFLIKFHDSNTPLRTITVPPIDHIAGLDVLFYALTSNSTLICTPNRNPETICQLVEQHKVELLPASVTFLNLILLSQAYQKFDLSSLRIIAFGSEIMPQNTLLQLHEIFPQVKMVQKYGTSELGSPSTQSKESAELLFKIKNSDYEIKIVENILWIRTKSAMVGYLNAPSPFDEDGWMNTGDEVEVDGDYIRILGRKSEIINVGGKKVYPAEIENVIMQIDNICDATIYGEKNPIMGNIVCLKVNLKKPENLTELKQRIRDFCQNKLASYKIPIKVEITNQKQFSQRFKKTRNPNNL